MKITKLPDEPTPDRMGVRSQVRRKGSKRAGGIYTTDFVLIAEQEQMREEKKDIHGKNNMGPIRSQDISPRWDERQRALIEEFKKATR